MLKSLTAELSEETISPLHSRLLQTSRDLVDFSRRIMSTYYNEWDYYDQCYRGERMYDKQDKEADQRGEPTKMAIPLSYAQVQVFVAYMFSQYFQRPSFYQLTPTGQEDYNAAKIGEAFLTRDLSENQWSIKLYQWLTDIGRFGMGVVKHGWEVEVGTVYSKSEQAPIQMFGMTLRPGKTSLVKTQEVSYEGNRLMNISPYRFFPDIRLPLTRFHDGEFCASEDEFTYVKLKGMENRGEIAGVDFIPAFSKSQWDKRHSNFTGINPLEDNIGNVSAYTKDVKSTFCITEIQRWIIPSKFELADGTFLGDETEPVLYNIWYANDARILKCEPLGYAHNTFTYDCVQMSPDQHRMVNDGISGLIAHMQDVINWLLNSRITNVRKVISSFLVVDPQKIDINDIIQKKPLIKTKPGLGQRGIDAAIKQLTVQDVTQSHIADIQTLQSLMGLVTGVNESALGQFAKGRRSAKEAGNVFDATIGRLQMISRLIWDGGIAPLGQKMLSNLREGVDVETYVRTIGDLANMDAYNGFVKVDKAALIGNYDFEMYDGTLPSDRDDMANVLQEVLVAIIQNPEGVQIFNLNPSKILREIASLKGIKHISRFDVMQTDSYGNIIQPPTPATNGPVGQPQPPAGAVGPGPGGPTAGGGIPGLSVPGGLGVGGTGQGLFASDPILSSLIQPRTVAAAP